MLQRTALRLAAALVALSVVGLSRASAAPSATIPPPQREIAWVEAKLDVALARARDRNVPLVVFACLADETHNEEYRRHLGGNEKLAQVLDGAVPMYASNGEPPPGAQLVKHKELMDEVYNRWVAEETPDGAWALPEVLVVDPSGEVFKRLGSGNTVTDDAVGFALAELNKKLGGGVSDVTVTSLVKLRDAGRAAQTAEDWTAAWRAWRSVLAITQAGVFATEAKAAMPAVEAGFTKLVEASVVDVTEANLGERYALLREVARRARGEALEKLATKHIGALEKDKRFKKLLTPIKLEEEAADILYEVEARLARGDTPGAIKELKRLASKRYAATASGQRARAEYAELLK
ncbi:MAG: hypothetical protein R3F49_00490 [Planctomycetota bacterium]